MNIKHIRCFTDTVSGWLAHVIVALFRIVDLTFSFVVKSIGKVLDVR